MDLADQSQPTVLTTSFIWQQIDLGINEQMYQVLKQLYEIVKPMVQNEVHYERELEKKQTNVGETLAHFVVAGQTGHPTGTQVQLGPQLTGHFYVSAYIQRRRYKTEFAICVGTYAPNAY